MYYNKIVVLASKVYSGLNNNPRNNIACANFQPHNTITSTEYIYKDSRRDISNIEKSRTLISTINHSNIVE